MVFPKGYTGPIAIVREGTYMLLAVIQLQQNGMGVQFPIYSTLCMLTHMSGNEEAVFAEIVQSFPLQLYFIDIYNIYICKLMTSYTTR